MKKKRILTALALVFVLTTLCSTVAFAPGMSPCHRKHMELRQIAGADRGQ